MILDAPIVIDQGPGLPLWRPENYAQDFLGAATMRGGLENSRNLMTIRVAQTIGMAKVAEMATRLGVIDNMQQTLAMSLGAGETTVLRMAAAYADDRQRRQEDRADLHRPHPGQPRLDHLSPRPAAVRRLPDVEL